MKLSRKEFLYSMNREERLEFLAKELKENEEKQEESQRVYLSGDALVLDLGFTESMKESEVNSMICQIRMTVGYLRKQKPQFFKLVCANVTEQMKSVLTKKGAKKWKVDLEGKGVRDMDASQGKEIVVLSPDAEEVLDEVDCARFVYVVGGLVDRTVLARQTLNMAGREGFRACRLPVREYLKGIVDPSRLKKILNINTVIEIIHKRASGMDWTNCFLTSLPYRWTKKDDQDLAK